jgi:hypothetical protein
LISMGPEFGRAVSPISCSMVEGIMQSHKPFDALKIGQGISYVIVRPRVCGIASLMTKTCGGRRALEVCRSLRYGYCYSSFQRRSYINTQ